MPKFSGFARYENSFSFDGEVPFLLTVSDAHEGVEVFLNGTSQGIQIVPPFRYRLEEGLLHGENTLTVEVATTLERENSGKPDITGQEPDPAMLEMAQAEAPAVGPKTGTRPSGLYESMLKEVAPVTTCQGLFNISMKKARILFSFRAS